MIFYNGATGSIGRYMFVTSQSISTQHQPIGLSTRLELYSALADELNQYQTQLDTCECVTLIHLAAMVSVEECEQNPDKAWLTNVDHSLKYIEAFVRWAKSYQKIPRVLYSSTGHVYQQSIETEVIDEDAPKLPRSIYAQTKLACETRLLDLAKQYSFELVIGRIFGVIGPKQPPQYVLQGLLRRTISLNFKQIPGLNNIRDYLDSRDICQILLRIADSNTSWQNMPTVVNICTGQGISIKMMMIEILKQAYPNQWIEYQNLLEEAPGRESDIVRIVGNPTRLNHRFKIEITPTPLIDTVREAWQAFHRPQPS